MNPQTLESEVLDVDHLAFPAGPPRERWPENAQPRAGRTKLFRVQARERRIARSDARRPSTRGLPRTCLNARLRDPRDRGPSWKVRAGSSGATRTVPLFAIGSARRRQARQAYPPFYVALRGARPIPRLRKAVQKETGVTPGVSLLRQPWSHPNLLFSRTAPPELASGKPRIRTSSFSALDRAGVATATDDFWTHSPRPWLATRFN